MSGHISGDKIVVIETRRRWSADERRLAVEETQHLAVSAVARKHGIAKSLLFRWRKEAGHSGKRRHVEGFVPVQIAASRREALVSPIVSSVAEISLPVASASVPVTHEVGSIEIELVGGTKLRVSGTVRPEALRQVIAALTSSPPLGSSAS